MSRKPTYYRSASIAALSVPVMAAFALLGATGVRAVSCAGTPCNPYVVTIHQDGLNVVATGSGEFNLTDLGPNGFPTITAASINPGAPSVTLTTGATDAFVKFGGLTGPADFGTGGLQNASSSSGDAVAFANFPSGGLQTLQVPSMYTSGAMLASEAVFDNATFASLGITPGEVFKWTWGSAPDESFTVDTTPLPAALPLFATGLGALGLVGWRRKRKSRVSLLGAA